MAIAFFSNAGPVYEALIPPAYVTASGATRSGRNSSALPVSAKLSADGDHDPWAARGDDCFRSPQHPLLDEPVGRICRLHRVARPRVLAANPGVSARQTSNLFETGKSESDLCPQKQVFTKLRNNGLLSAVRTSKFLSAARRSYLTVRGSRGMFGT
jgi:hypothetical protein